MSLVALEWALRDPLIQTIQWAPARHVLVILADHANEAQGHVAWPAVATIADETSLSQTTVYKALAFLAEHSVIVNEGFAEGSRRRRLNVQWTLQPGRAGLSASADPPRDGGDVRHDPPRDGGDVRHDPPRRVRGGSADPPSHGGKPEPEPEPQPPKPPSLHEKLLEERKRVGGEGQGDPGDPSRASGEAAFDAESDAEVIS